MKSKLFIYGAGGLGREVLSLIRMMNQWDPAGFFDDHVPEGTVIAGLRVLGGRQALHAPKEMYNLVIAIGDPRIKTQVVSALNTEHIAFPPIVHPLAVLQDPATIRIGSGAIVTPGCVLTTNINIGNHVLVNLNCTIGHDVNIGDFTSIMPGVNIAGEVAIGDSVLVGSGVNILNRIRIGDEARVGMGGVVIHDVAAKQTVVGVPAKPIHS